MIQITKSQSWTMEEVQKLREMAGEQVPPHIISMKLGRSIEAIYGKLSELGLPYRPE